ncbi:MAG: hypothetical protein ABI273_04990 [Lacunisphaera sp.]
MIGRRPVIGRRKYAEYLAWLAENEAGRKQLKFESMSRGWVLGGQAFKQALLKEHRAKLAQGGREERSTRETRELLWSEALKTALARLNRTVSDVRQDRKAAAWKVAVAAQLKTVSTASNVWLAEQLCMGAADGVSRYVSELRRGQRKEAEKIRKEITDIRV